jgi:hypothetical protein
LTTACTRRSATSATPKNISKSYVSRILRLALLAPDIVEAILSGKGNRGMMLEPLERPLPASWKVQRDLLTHLGALPS